MDPASLDAGIGTDEPGRRQRDLNDGLRRGDLPQAVSFGSASGVAGLQ
jgi:hypothetical protein